LKKIGGNSFFPFIQNLYQKDNIGHMAMFHFIQHLQIKRINKFLEKLLIFSNKIEKNTFNSGKGSSILKSSIKVSGGFDSITKTIILKLI